MTARQIADNERILAVLKQQSDAMLQAYHANPRLSSTFATQQRWLLGHAALALHFRAALGAEPPVTLSRVFDVVARHDLSSRNTADAFVKEMLHYGYVTQAISPSDKRARPFVVSDVALAGIHGWTVTHLMTLDRLDGGQRLEAFMERDGALAVVHPQIADRLMTDPAIRQPKKTFSLFTWLNNGGNIMDWLILGLGELDADGRTYPTSVTSIADLAGWLPLSRSHLARKLREAEAMGSLGWSGDRGSSHMWVSAGFVDEMIEAQAAKLAVIDDAFESCFAR